MIPFKYNVRSLAERRTSSVMTVLGVALVAMTLFLILGLFEGLRHTVRAGAGAGNWVVLERGATAEPGSYISHAQLQILSARSEIATDAKGASLMSPEYISGLNVSPDRRRTRFTFMRGVKPIAYEVHRRMRLVRGRWPAPGRDEWAIGQRLAARYPSLGIGSVHHFGRSDWTVVGVFSDAGSARESEVWTDYDAQATDAHAQEPGAKSIRVVLKPGLARQFKDALHNDGRLKVDAMTEAEFYRDQSELDARLRTLAGIVAVLMAAGAIFGGMNTMYSAVARRSREVGVLRSIGFTPAAIVASFIVESALIGLAGGILGEAMGVLGAYAAGLQSTMMNVGMLIFSFRLASASFVAAAAAAVLIGVLGGILPALRASRIGVVEALRAP